MVGGLDKKLFFMQSLCSSKCFFPFGLCRMADSGQLNPLHGKCYRSEEMGITNFSRPVPRNGHSVTSTVWDWPGSTEPASIQKKRKTNLTCQWSE